MNEYEEVRMTKQVLVSFSIGKFKDKVLCDVILMHSTHLLSRRPWQFDMKTKHDEFKKIYCEERWKIYTLALLRPRQMYADQLKLKKVEKAK